MSFIKLDRKIIDSEIFAHDGKFRFWIWLLIEANYKNRFASIKIGAGQSTVEVKRGDLIFGRNSASSILGVNPATLYVWLKKFEEMKMVELKSSKHFTMVTICKYDEYQSVDLDKLATDSQPISDQLSTVSPPFSTPKEIQEIKEIKEEYIPADEPPATQTPKFNFKKSLLDSGADEHLIDDWLKVRKELKATNTETALSKFLNEVKASGHTINEVLKICCEKSWKGFNHTWKVEWDTPARPPRPEIDMSDPNPKLVKL